uniref:Uncharacterized protein n=1 Tax=Anguilla anguilla TaxID=7936 RepID=A0A0E9XGB8_ANGAN
MQIVQFRGLWRPCTTSLSSRNVEDLLNAKMQENCI